MDEAGDQRGRGQRRVPKPLDEERLRELALHYVGKFATTRAKLRTYLNRKLRERGWAGAAPADVAALVERIGELGYVDDHAYAVAKARSLSARGFGTRRVRQALQQAGVSEPDAEDGEQLARDQALDSALRFARRKRIGPFAVGETDPATREKALAALIRAGHDFRLARRIVEAAPGEELNLAD